MKTYSVRVSRRDAGWDAGIDGVGWIRVDRLTGVERSVRAHLAVLGFGDATTARVTLDYGPELGKEVDAVREARSSAEGWVRYAADRSRELSTRLVEQGMSGAEVALILGISPQRVSQLVSPAKKKAVDVRTSAAKLLKKQRKAEKLAKKAAETAASQDIAS